MRRSGGVFVVLLVCALLFSACGGEEDTDSIASKAYGYEVTGCEQSEELNSAAETLNAAATIYICDDGLGVAVDDDPGETYTFAAPLE